MPTPHELMIAKRHAALQRHGDDFYVQEVVECLSSDDSDAGEEDLPLEQRTAYQREARRAAEGAARKADAQRAVEREHGRGARARADGTRAENPGPDLEGDDPRMAATSDARWLRASAPVAQCAADEPD